MSFFSTHNHTALGSNLRLRDSTNRVEDMFDYAEELGYSGFCLTEHESITSALYALKYYKKWVKEKPERKNFKLGLGNEIYLCPEFVNEENKATNLYPHFILVATDEIGHRGIRELSTQSWTKNSFMHVMYRVPTHYSELEELMKTYKGHIIGQSACLGGSLPRQLLKFKEDCSSETWRSCIMWIEYMNEIFGEGYFFLELQPGRTMEQMYVNQQLINLSEITNTPYIISTDSHYLKESERPIHAAYLNSEDGDREVDEFYESTYMMSEEEIHDRMDDYLGYDDVQTGIDNTQLIYDKIEYFDLEKPLHIPYLPVNTTEPDKKLYKKYKDKMPLLEHFYNSSYDSDRHMVRKMLESIDKYPHYQTEKGYAAVEECLEYLKQSSDKMNVPWSAYLMQVADYVRLAWEAGTLVGPARGSGGGFCILFLLDIIQIDVLREETKMYPARFLNPERASVLDIDVDIESAAREKVIQKFKDTYGADRVSKVMTLSTEKSRSAILTAGRGLGMSNDLTSYIASLIVADRGNPRTLKQMYYGDPENDIKPVGEFVTEMNNHPDLWETAQKIEGLVSGVGSHAGGIIVVDEPFTNSTALMKTKSGDIITQFDLHMCEDVSLIKMDLLSVDCLDKIHTTLNLLMENNIIQWQGSLYDTYEKYMNVYQLERSAEDMWKLLWEHKVISAFQMEKESGKQALALAKPYSVDDLATINSVIRLMAQEKGGEPPLQKYARFHENIELWYQEMTDYGLTEEEQDILKEILGISCGICEAQEYLMLLTMHPKIGGFSLGWADKLRKAVAKFLASCLETNKIATGKIGECCMVSCS